MRRSDDHWLEPMGRLGYAAKGVIYVAIGLLSATAALGGGRARDSRDILRTVAEQPFGKILLAALTMGIACYTAWRLVVACRGSTRGVGLQEIALRLRSLASAIVYGSLGFAAVRILAGGGGSRGSDATARDSTARLMSAPFGKWLVVSVGAGFIGYGLYQFWRAAKGSFEKKLDMASVPTETRCWLHRICTMGIGARGVAFCLIGIFLIQAGLHTNPSAARGLRGALDSLRAQPYGGWLLAAVALGLAAYGIYCAVKARFGRLNPVQ